MIFGIIKQEVEGIWDSCKIVIKCKKGQEDESYSYIWLQIRFFCIYSSFILYFLLLNNDEYEI